MKNNISADLFIIILEDNAKPFLSRVYGLLQRYSLKEIQWVIDTCFQEYVYKDGAYSENELEFYLSSYRQAGDVIIGLAEAIACGPPTNIKFDVNIEDFKDFAEKSIPYVSINRDDYTSPLDLLALAVMDFYEMAAPQYLTNQLFKGYSAMLSKDRKIESGNSDIRELFYYYSVIKNLIKLADNAGVQIANYLEPKEGV